MSGGIIAFPIRVCHGLDSNILDKLLTWWYRNKKKSVIMVFTRVREATSFYCRTSGIVSSMCEKEFFLSSQRFFHIPKGGRESRPASVFFFQWRERTLLRHRKSHKEGKWTVFRYFGQKSYRKFWTVHVFLQNKQYPLLLIRKHCLSL